jgi:trehalose 6-phosphate phosphatase
MFRILAKRHSSTLADFAASNVLLAFDYDGTLASITSDPAEAQLRSKIRRLLSTVARRYPCVVISGRTRHDVARRLARIPVSYVFGNHGIEPWGQNASYAGQVRRWVDRLERQLAPHRGLSIEAKTYSVAIHYRNARHKQRALRAIHELVGGFRGARALGGEQAVNLIPRDAPDKGMALERARRLLACDRAIYVGDDETDEDAFLSATPDRLLSIKVGATRRSRARYCLETQNEIDVLLQRLLLLRPARPARLTRR